MGTVVRLDRGVRGPAGTTIRFTREGDDLEEVTAAYTAATGHPFPLIDLTRAADSGPDWGWAPRTALTRGSIDPVRDRLDEGGHGLGLVFDWYGAMLVATTAQQRVVGTVHACPPALTLDPSTPPQTASRLCISVTRINALSVIPEFRGRAIAMALLKNLVLTFRALNTALMFGQYHDPGLGAFYTRTGFEIVPDGNAVDFQDVTGQQLQILDPHDTMFVRRISPDYRGVLHNRVHPQARTQYPHWMQP